MPRRPQIVPALPGTGENASAVLARSIDVAGTPGAAYLVKRRVPPLVAADQGVRYCGDLNRRSALVVPLIGPKGDLVAVHGRYIEQRGKEPRMYDLGQPGGVFAPPGSLETTPLVLVEGLFDSLALATCDVQVVAVMGARIGWLAQVAAGREVLLAFDNNRPGDRLGRYYDGALGGAVCRRLRPPDRRADWATALKVIGRRRLREWLWGLPGLVKGEDPCEAPN